MYLNIAILLFLVLYKGYLLIYETDFESQNIKNIEKIQSIDKREFSFAVFGNIRSSISVFDKKIIQSVNSDESIDFGISNGDAILDGAEDKYRILNESIKKMDIPMVIGVGDRELLDGGEENFYDHYGPYFFSFDVKDSYFIFMDTSGKTSKEWQKNWLVKELEVAEDYSHRFVFMNKSLIRLETNDQVDAEENYILDESYKDFLMRAFSKYKVTGVLSSVAGMSAQEAIDGVDYIVSGGAGGTLLPENKESFYHYLKVTIKPSGVQYEFIEERDHEQSVFFKILENIWITIHSIFYINYINFIILLGAILLIIISVYNKASKPVDYYRNFDEDKIEKNNKKLKIAMLTNTYLPFIGGVPISINRLVKGLRKKGHEVTIVAPEYPDLETLEDENVIRMPLLKYFKPEGFSFPVANIFSSKFKQVFNENQYDLIHVHHPFWMGWKGLRLGKKYDLPVVLTYHTRLELYAHYLPFFNLIFKNIVSHKMIKRFAQKCDAIISPTYTAKEYLKNIGVSRKKYVIPTGINREAYEKVTERSIEDIRNQYRSSNEILTCTVTRLSKEKNIYFLLNGIKKIKEEAELNFKHLIIGDGGEFKAIEQYIVENDLEEYITLVGKIDPEEIIKYYIASDLFLFSSLSETQGMVIVEAMAGGCPVVALRASGIEDLIENKSNGFKTKNDLEKWTEKVILLMKDKALREQLGKNAKEFSKAYSSEAIAEKVLEAYYYSILREENKIQ